MTKSKNNGLPAVAEMPPNPDDTKDFQAEVSIDLIAFSETNEMFRSDEDLESPALKELADSISQKGLLQPILVRPKGNGSFILVAGERRLRACKSLGMETIPAYCKHMTKEEAFELQLTENLQRKDVHPMKEAKAFKYLLDNSGWSTAELALRFGKSETYVLQRVKLMSMLPEIQKDFEKGDLTLAQALVIARLQQGDQKEIIENCKNHEGQLDSKRNYYRTAQELEDYIQENITRDLNNVPWDLNDATIVPKAGACSSCQKRSGAQSTLFADIKEKDRCFDSACFKSKLNAGLFIKVKKLVEEKPDTIFLEASGWGVDKVDQRIASFLSGHKIKPLSYQSYSDYQSYDHKKKISGFYINGAHAGRTHFVYVAGPETKAVKGSSASGEQKVTPSDIKESIERIKERTKRAAELDAEKVYDRILELLQKDVDMDDPSKPGTAAEWGLLARYLYEDLDFEDQEKANKLLGIKGKLTDEQEADRFLSVNPQQILWMVRMLAPDQAKRGNNFLWPHDSVEGILIRRMAKNWGIDVDGLDTEQAVLRAKREQSAKARIAELQASLKPKKEKGGVKK